MGVIKEIQENPYLQYFIGMEKFSHEAPVKPTVLVNFRKRRSADYLMEANEYILEISGATKEHDATCSLPIIRYPRDFSLINETREKLEDMIDYFHREFHPWDKTRTYRRTSRKEYLALAKSKKRTEKKIRSVIRKQLSCIRRDLGYLEKYMGEGYALASKYTDCYLTILKLYEHAIITCLVICMTSLIVGKKFGPKRGQMDFSCEICNNYTHNNKT